MQTLLVAGVWLALQAAASTGDVMRIDWSRIADRNTDLAAVRAEYVAAVNAHDAGTASAVYDANAVALFGDTEILRGRTALGGRLEDSFGRLAGTVTLIPRSFATSRDVGSETGTFTVAAPDGATALEGAYVTVYSRDAEGRWRIAMEIRTAGGSGAAGAW